MNNKFVIIYTALLTCFISSLLGQGNGKYLIDNFTGSDLGSSVVNWEIIQTQTGEMYVANTEGLLKYDGNKWSKVLTQRVVSLAVGNNGIIYLGGYGDFGYLSSNANGQLIFKTLKHLLDDEIDFKSTVWDVVPLNDDVYFSSKQGIFKWDGLRMKIWKSIPGQEYSTFITVVGNQIATTKENYGIVVLNQDGDSTIFSHLELKNEHLFSIEKKNNFFQFGLKHLGVIQNGGSQQIIEVNKQANEFFKNNRMFTPKIDINNSFYFGTHAGGIVELDTNFRIKNIIDEKVGLQDNGIRDIVLDNNNVLWAALQRGVSNINISSPWTIYDENSGIQGSLWLKSILKFRDKLLIGTTKGLFYCTDNKFEKVDFINSKVWSISSINFINGDLGLAISTEQGLYILSEDLKIIKLIRDNTTTNTFSTKSYPSILLVSKSEEIVKIELDNNYNTKSLLAFESKDQVVLDRYEDKYGNIWFGARGLGLYRIKDLNSEIPVITLYSKNKGIEGFENISFAQLENSFLVGTTEGLFRYNFNIDKFEKIRFIDGVVNEIESINDSTFYISYYDNDNLNRIEKIILKNNELVHKSITPYKKLKNTSLNSIYFDSIYSYFSTGDGLYQFDETVVKDYDVPFNTLINRTSSLDSLLFGGTYTDYVDGNKPIIVSYQPASYQPTLSYDNNSIRFEYSATFYEESQKNEFSYYLEGNDKSWSVWSTENIKEYNNLSPGHYTFHVKSKNIYDKEGRVAKYEFTILAPWYMTAWAYALFTLAAGLFIWFVALAYTYRVRQQRRKLKLLVADRTFEVLSQKKEIEQQNEVLKEQYEEIQQQRDSIDEKNQELEMSQEEILSINERLQELNLSLEKKVDERTTEIKATVKKLQSSIAELDTFIYRASHDLKGPISRINGLTSLAKLEATNPNDVKYYNLIELVAKDMNKLLAKLTQVHEVINCQPEPEWVDLPVLITDIRNSIKFLDPDEKTKYAFVLESTLQVKTDPYLLSVILTNLMENSLVFKNPSNEIAIVKISSGQNDAQFEILIEDNGMGIPVEHIDKVFNMFYRGSDQSKGSGLGLYLAQMAADKLGGKLIVESEFGKFTKFTVMLPKKIS